MNAEGKGRWLAWPGSRAEGAAEGAVEGAVEGRTVLTFSWK